MQIITLKMEKTGKIYFFAHLARKDSLRALAGFLDEYGSPSEDFIQWLCNPDQDEDETEIIHIAKKNGAVTIIYPYWNEIPFFQEFAVKLVKLMKELDSLENQKPSEIAIMRENGDYYLKPITLYSLSFLKIGEKKYQTDGVNKDDQEVGALGKFLESLSDFTLIIEWFHTDDSEIKTPVGKLIKNNNSIIIEYNKPEYFLHLTTTLPFHLFLKIIEKYQQLINEDHEEFLLLEEPDYYAFMTNPFEEMKIPKK